MVYVINKNGKPLMPCSPAIARLLMKNGKAVCKRRTPFTIKLTVETTDYIQELALGIDTGSSKLGSAVVNGNKEVIYLSEVEVRNDITSKMERRRSYRRTRRNRKTRYRKPRWLNMGSSTKTGRFLPTILSKLNSHLKEIRYVKGLLPITKVIIETATFDTHALKNPEVLNKKWLYRQGINYGYVNTKAYVLTRDAYTCQHCKGKTKDRRLEVHHIVFRRDNGSDEADNLITLCKSCHDSLHRGELVLKGGKRKGNLKHATQMNSIRIQLLKRLPEAMETFGYVTKEHRQLTGIGKAHHIDAVFIALQGSEVTFKTETLLVKRCVSKGDYQQTKGVRSQQRIPTGKIQGFRKYDKVCYLGGAYFIKGRMSAGYAVLMGIDGSKVVFKDAPKGMKTPKLGNLRRLSSRSSWLIEEQNRVNSSHD